MFRFFSKKEKSDSILIFKFAKKNREIFPNFMIKSASALLIVALGQFNSSLKNKEILPQKFGQFFIDKPHKLSDSKTAKMPIKAVSLAQKKSLKKIPHSQFFNAHNLAFATTKTSPSNLVNFVSLSFSSRARALSSCCCMSA